MNLLSVAAAYGVVTAVFQLGWGASLIGLDHSIPIVSFVPLLMFAILFGLSMDYEVFLLTQMREHYRAERRREGGGDRRAGQHRPGDHLGGGDHGLRLHQLRPQRQPDREGVRRRPGGGDRDRLDPGPLPAGAGGDGPARHAAPGGCRAGSDALVPHISIEGEEFFAKRDAALAADGPKVDRGRLGPSAVMFPLNLPNALTLLRILAVPVVVVALLGETPNGDALAAAVFALAALTDGLDGYFARSRDAVTTFGKLMDPLADKLLITAALVSLVSLDRLAGLGGDGDHRPRDRRHRAAGDRRRARRRDRRQLDGQAEDGAADRRRLRPDRRQPGPGLGRRPRLPRRRRDRDQRRRLLLRPAPAARAEREAALPRRLEPARPPATRASSCGGAGARRSSSSARRSSSLP